MKEDVKVALRGAELLEKFAALAPSHQREYLRWINEAKKPETRARRIQKMCDMLISGKKS